MAIVSVVDGVTSRSKATPKTKIRFRQKQAWKEKTAEKVKELAAQHTDSNDLDLIKQELQSDEGSLKQASITYLSLQHP